jgi:hypothetical protein
VIAALAVVYHITGPVQGDASVQVVEKRERSISDDPAVRGDFPTKGWRVTEGERASPPQLPAEEAELPEFIEAYQNTQAPKIVEEQLAPGATRGVDLQLAGPSGLAGSVRWIGTTDALKVTIALGGSTLVTGTPYRLGTTRGGSFLAVRTTGGGHATLSVTNTSGVTVRVRVLLMATPL